MKMSFENGYNAKDYILDCMERYRADNSIFQKALQTIMFFAVLPQWPQNFRKMKDVISLIIGVNLGEFLRFMSQYLAFKGSETVPQIDWSHTTPQFVAEAEAFFLTVDDFLYRAVQARICPLKVYEVLFSKNSLDDGAKTTVKFIRTDGASLEMEMSSEDIKNLITLLEGLPKNAEAEFYPL